MLNKELYIHFPTNFPDKGQSLNEPYLYSQLKAPMQKSNSLSHNTFSNFNWRFHVTRPPSKKHVVLDLAASRIIIKV